MGCDIHVFVEYRKSDFGWRSFGNKFRPNRNYLMFGLLCQGVRSENPDGIQAKGYPADAGSSADENMFYYISDSSDYRSVNKSTAEKWLTYGSFYRGESKDFISNPDYHSATWLTDAEYRSQLEKYQLVADAHGWKEPEYWAILSAMEYFISEGFETRIVFWFDN